MADGDNFDKHGKLGWKSTARRFYERDRGLEDSAFRSLRKVFLSGMAGAYPDAVDALFDHASQRTLTGDWRNDVSERLDRIATQHGDELSRALIQVARDLAVSPMAVDIVGASSSDRVRAEIGRSLLTELVGVVVTAPGLVESLLSGRYRIHLTQAQFLDLEVESIRRLKRSDKVLRVAIEGLGLRPSQIMGKHTRTPTAKSSQRDLVHRPFNVGHEESSHAAD